MDPQNISAQPVSQELPVNRQPSPIKRILVFGVIVLLFILGILSAYKAGLKQASKQLNSTTPIVLLTPTTIIKPTQPLSAIVPTSIINVTPLPDLKEKSPVINVILPPKGDYCNGCVDSAPGSQPNPQIVSGEWVSGGFDSAQATRKWSYISYVFKGLLPVLSESSGLIMPQGNFLQEAVNISVNSSKTFGKYNYSRLPDQTSKDGIKINVYKVTPFFDDDSIGRIDAIFTKGTNTFYLMFDWKNHNFDNTFDQIIESLYLSR